MTRVTWRSVVSWIVETALVVTAVAYVLIGLDQLMLLWELLGAGYLTAGALAAWRDAVQPRATTRRRTPVANTWLLPLISSASGLLCALNALKAQAGAAKDDTDLVLSVMASVGVIVSWLLLNTGFADVYERATAGDKDALEFPGVSTPRRIDYLYFALTVGTSFATSDVTVRSRSVRRVVVVHGVFSFFYNALVVAVAFQVLQQLFGS